MYVQKRVGEEERGGESEGSNRAVRGARGGFILFGSFDFLRSRISDLLLPQIKRSQACQARFSFTSVALM